MSKHNLFIQPLFDLIINALEDNNQEIALAMMLKLKASQEEQFWEYFSNEIKNKYTQEEIFSTIVDISEMSKEEVTLSILNELTVDEKRQFKEFAISEIKRKFHTAEDIQHNIIVFETRLMQIKTRGSLQIEPEGIPSSACRQRISRKQRSDSEVGQPILVHYEKTNQSSNNKEIAQTFDSTDDDNVRCFCFRF